MAVHRCSAVLIAPHSVWIMLPCHTADVLEASLRRHATLRTLEWKHRVSVYNWGKWLVIM